MKLFDFIYKIIDGDSNAIDNLSEEEIKDFNPYLIQLWLSGAKINNDIHTLYTNEVVSKYIFPLAKHKKLLFKLFCIGNNTGDFTKFEFPKKKIVFSKLIKAVTTYYDVGKIEAIEYLNILSHEDILEIADALAYDDKEFKDLKKESELFYNKD